jgi:predicted  nucleic acid-binding Zn-ribbon protein
MADESFITEFKQSIQNLKNINGTISQKYTDNVATIKNNLSGINEKVKIIKKSIIDRVAEYNKRINDIKSVKQMTQNRLETALSTNKSYEIKMVELQKQIDAKESQIQTANASLQAKISETNELQQQIRLLTTETQSLKSQLASIQNLVKNNSNPKSQDARDVVEQIENQANKNSTQLQLLQTQLSKKDTEIQQLNQKINDLAQQLNEKTNNLQQIGSNIENLNKEIVLLTQKNESLKAIIIQATQDINETMANINNIINNQNISSNPDVASSLNEIISNIDSILNQLKSVSEANLNTINNRNNDTDSDDEEPNNKPNLTSSVTGALQGALQGAQGLFNTATSQEDSDDENDAAAPSTIPQQGPSTIPQQGPSTIPQQGPSTIPQQGPSTIPQPGPGQLGPNNIRSIRGQASNVLGTNPQLSIPTDDKKIPYVKMGREKVLGMLDKEFKDVSLDARKRVNIKAMIDFINNSDLDGIRQIEDKFKELNIVCQGCTGKNGVGKFIVNLPPSGGKTRRVRKLNKTRKQKGGFTYSKKNKRHKISSPLSSKMSSSRMSSSRRSSSRPRRKR